MKNLLTPTERLRSHFKALDRVMKLSARIDRLVLNKHEPHYNPMGWMTDRAGYSKGVKSDCVYVYVFESHKKRYSGGYSWTNEPKMGLAFSFNYKDENEADTFYISLMLGGEIRYSQTLAFDELRLALNTLNKTFDAKRPDNRDELWQAILDWAIPLVEQGGENATEADKAVTASEKLASVFDGAITIADASAQAIRDAREANKEANKKAQSAIKRTKAYKEVQRLKALLAQAQVELSEKEAEMNEKHQANSTHDAIEQAEAAHVTACDSQIAVLQNALADDEYVRASFQQRNRVKEGIKTLKSPYYRQGKL